MATIADLPIVRLVADTETPNSLTALAGTLVHSDSLPSPLPTDPDSRTLLVDIWGFARTGTDGVTEWVMCERVNRPLRLAINAIPGTGGWQSVDARQVYRQVGRRLLESLLMPAADIPPFLTELYNAAVVELTARGWRLP